MTVTTILQDDVNAGGIATVNRWYRAWMDRHRPGERQEFYFDDTSGTADLIRLWTTWDGSSSAIPRLLPQLHVPQYVSGRILLARARMHSCETHVIGAVAIHGALRDATTPSLVWCATTLRDERRAVAPHHARTRRTLHAATLPALERIELSVLKSASRIMAMSRHTARCIERLGIHGARISLQPVPIDTDVFSPGDEERRGILFVGRAHDPRKGFPRVLRLLRVSPSAFAHGVTVVSPGDPIGVAPSVRPAVRWTAPVRDVAPLYRSAELLLLPSHQEGLGIVAFEALSSGTPVVSWACGGPDDFLRRSGGAIVVTTTDEMVSAVDRLLNDPGLRSELGNRGRSWVEQHMSARQFLEQPGLFRAT